MLYYNKRRDGKYVGRIQKDIRPERRTVMNTTDDFFESAEEQAEDIEVAETDIEDNSDMFDMDFSDVEEEEAREAARAEKRAERKKARENKNRFTLIVRILLIATVPILLISLFYLLSSQSSARKLTHRLLQSEMEGLTVSAVEAFTVYARGDYSYTDGVFYKGTTDMEPMYEYLDDMSEKVGADIMVFYGDTCVMTTFKDENGNPYSGTKIDADNYENIVLKYVYKGNYYYDSDTTFSGKPYATYYYPLMQESTGEIVGAMFCGVDRTGVNASMNGALAVLITVGLILAILFAALCFYEVRHITTAVNRSVGSLTEVSNGNLAVKVSEDSMKRKDEIGDIARGVKQLVEKLSCIIGSIKASTKEVADFSDLMNESMSKIAETVNSVNLAVEEIAKGATSQATETMQANTQVAQIGEAIEMTVSEVEHLSVSAKKMDEYSIDADKTLQELLIISKEADDAINEIKRQTNETNVSAQQIQKATDMITAIASQTNLLSLNASIEAARAGEAGMGFAVVADEIRQLAEQSRTSAEEIREIVETLISNSDTSVKTMNGVSDSINVQNDKLDETLKVFTELNAEVSSVMKAIKEISKQTKALSELREGVVNIVEGLAAIAEENAASAEETSASMYEVGTIVDECTKQTQELAVLKQELENDIALFSLNAEKMNGDVAKDEPAEEGSAEEVTENGAGSEDEEAVSEETDK